MEAQELVGVVSYTLQSGLLLAVGLLLPAALKLRDPRVSLAYWRALMPTVVLAPLAFSWLRPEASPVGAVLPSFEMQEIVTVSGASSGTLTQWSAVALVILTVALLRLGWMAGGFVALSKLRARARELTPLPDAITMIQKRLGARADFLVSEDVASPITLGWKRPAVLVPPRFLDLDAEEQEGVACHELLHVRRGDWPAAIVEEIIRSVLWFHPAMWVISRRVALSREQLIDSQVVVITGKRRAYLEVLWKTAVARTSDQLTPVLSLLNGSQLVDRVALLTKEVAMSRLRINATVLALAVALGASGVVAAVAFPMLAAAPSTAPLAMNSSDEPVAYDQDDPSMTAPEVVHKVNPVYPEEAKKNGLSGIVSCRATITVGGDVVKAEIHKTSDEIFNQSVIDAVMQWKFKPATKDGEPIAATYVVTLKFKLK